MYIVYAESHAYTAVSYTVPVAIHWQYTYVSCALYKEPFRFLHILMEDDCIDV